MKTLKKREINQILFKKEIEMSRILPKIPYSE